MRFFRSFICLLLTFTIPAMHLQGYADFPMHSYKWASEDQLVANLHLLTYDEILRLLDEIESGELEKRCSFATWEKINHFLFTLTNVGLQAQGAEFEAADYEQIYALANDQSYIISHAVYYGDGDMFYSKASWASAWQNTKDFCQKHKTAIIIGVVIVVAVVTVVTIAVVASSTAATTAVAAVAGSAAGAANINEPPVQNSPPLETKEETPALTVPSNPIEINQSSAIKEIIYEHLEPIKDMAQENVDSSSFREKAREFGSHLTHEALHSVAELTSILPQLQQELADLSGQFLPQGIIPEESKCPKDNFDEWIAQGHEKIDRAFSTDYADYYTTGARSQQDSECTMGMLPPPGKFIEIGPRELKKLAEGGKAIDRGGFTKAGRGSVKHSYRKGSVFPKPVGNTKEVNKHGQKVLESILNHPQKKCFTNEFERYGKVLDIYAPDIGGVRYSIDGKFIGFLEP